MSSVHFLLGVVELVLLALPAATAHSQPPPLHAPSGSVATSARNRRALTSKFLFIEDGIIAPSTRRNVSLRLNPPAKSGRVLLPGHHWEAVGIGDGFSAVVQTPSSGLFLYYQCNGADMPYKTCVARSADGVTWRKPRLNVLLFDGQPSNVVFPLNTTENFETGGAFYDAADAQRPFKLTGLWGVVGSPWAVFVFASADGLHFNYQHGSSGGNVNHSLSTAAFGSSDTGNLCVPQPSSGSGDTKFGCYVRYDVETTTRDSCPGAPAPDPTVAPGATSGSRRIGLCETSDLGRWCTPNATTNTTCDKATLPSSSSQCRQVWPPNNAGTGPGDPPCLDFYNSAALQYEVRGLLATRFYDTRTAHVRRNYCHVSHHRTCG